jgi:hypothetical protein
MFHYPYFTTGRIESEKPDGCREYSLNHFETIVYTCVDNYRIERNMLATLVCPVWSGSTFTVLVLLPISGRTGEK